MQPRYPSYGVPLFLLSYMVNMVSPYFRVTSIIHESENSGQYTIFSPGE